MQEAQINPILLAENQQLITSRSAGQHHGVWLRASYPHGMHNATFQYLCHACVPSALRKGLDPCARTVTAALVAYACSGIAST